jgi:hypothetical protein
MASMVIDLDANGWTTQKIWSREPIVDRISEVLVALVIAQPPLRNLELPEHKFDPLEEAVGSVRHGEQFEPMDHFALRASANLRARPASTSSLGILFEVANGIFEFSEAAHSSTQSSAYAHFGAWSHRLNVRYRSSDSKSSNSAVGPHSVTRIVC